MTGGRAFLQINKIDTRGAAKAGLGIVFPLDAWISRACAFSVFHCLQIRLGDISRSFARVDDSRVHRDDDVPNIQICGSLEGS